MLLNDNGKLAIAQVAFFGPALLFSLGLTIRHGADRTLGWIYLVILSILRLIGSGAQLYIELRNDYSEGLAETVAVTSAIGTTPLILALDGLAQRVNTSIRDPSQRLPIQPFLAVRITAAVGLILSIVGGIYEPTTPAAYKAGNTGTDLIKAASILYAVGYILLSFITVRTFAYRHRAAVGEQIAVYADVLALVPLLVRIAYTILVAFYVDEDFFFRDVEIWAQALMQFVPEAVVVSLFVLAGVFAPKGGEVDAEFWVCEVFRGGGALWLGG